MSLPERAAEASFALLACLQRTGDAEGPERSAPTGTPAQEEEEEAPEAPMPWEEVQEPLPAELAKLWDRAQKGDRKTDLKSFMDLIPVFAGLPHRAPENNHKADAKNPWDKTQRVWSQLVLHSLRVAVTLHNGMLQQTTDENILALGQQNFFMLAEFYMRITNNRKEKSISGSVPVEEIN